MFKNIGGKIRVWAMFMCWVGIIVSVLVGGSFICYGIGLDPDRAIFMGDKTSGILTGVLILLAGSLASWIGSFVLYGFGQLVEKTEENNQYLCALVNAGEVSRDVYNDFFSKHPAAPSTTWVCKKCGTVNPLSRASCKNCGEYR